MHLASDISHFRALLPRARKIAASLLTAFWGGSPKQYRPENHYMRGPGPKWREKHSSAGDISEFVQIPVMLDQKWD